MKLNLVIKQAGKNKLKNIWIIEILSLSLYNKIKTYSSTKMAW